MPRKRNTERRPPYSHACAWLSILETHEKKAELDPGRGQECHATAKSEMARMHAVTTDKQPGDPVAGAKRIVDLVGTKLLGALQLACRYEFRSVRTQSK